MAVFQSFGYNPVRIDYENIEVREGATISAAIFNNLLGIISRPVAFFSSIFDKTLETISNVRNNININNINTRRKRMVSGL